MIVVAGGTGTLGTRLVKRLVDRDLRVRVLTRDVSRASHLAHPRIEIVHADVRSLASLPAAVAGADTVVSAIHGFTGPGLSPATVDYHGNGNLIDTAAGAGASFVLMSIVGAGPHSPMELFRAKYEAEQHLRKSDVAWTIVRATAFIETWTKIMAESFRATGKILVFGRGNNPINFVSADDVAALLELVVVDSTLRGRVIELGGPDNMTFNQIATMLQQISGRSAPVIHVPRFALQVMAVLMKLVNPEFARQAKAAATMDAADMTFDSSETRQAFATIPTTDIATAIEQHSLSD
jgi:uncharacterized protein YbjT (DUF2867 family)